MLPVVIAAAIWGRRWFGQRILFLSDNTAVVAVLTSRSAHNPILSHLLKCLFFWEAKFDFSHVAEHLPGEWNAAADALSRDNLSLLHSLNPQAARDPTPVPPALALLVTKHTLQWTSPNWVELFRDSLSKGTICLFAAFLAQRDLSPGSISTYLSAVRHLDIQSSASTTPRSAWPYLQYVYLDPRRTSSGNEPGVVLGKTDDDLCPVSALLAYLARRPGPGVGPLLIQEDGQPLTRDFFVHLLKEALGRCGIESGGYSGRSFRIGAATSAAKAGVPNHIIKAMGRWESEAYQTYIRSSPSTLAAVASSLSGSKGH
uniref:Tyr recombinase domain-containing protein n=1 Tax=Amphimedon queenslandica TaxID=400682 RepID=A0A1X7TIL8_AMPQE